MIMEQQRLKGCFPGIGSTVQLKQPWSIDFSYLYLPLDRAAHSWLVDDVKGLRKGTSEASALADVDELV